MPRDLREIGAKSAHEGVEDAENSPAPGNLHQGAEALHHGGNEERRKDLLFSPFPPFLYGGELFEA